MGSRDDTIDNSTKGPERLIWGFGPRRFELFLEPTCSHSARAFVKMKEFLAAAGEDRVTVEIWLHSQPWHTFSSVVIRTILAAAASDGGKEAAFQVMEAVFGNREEFILTEHASGANLDLTPRRILRRIEHLTGLNLGEAFELKAVTDTFKLHTRHARQNGIHESPTFMMDGLVDSRFSSQDEVAVWLEIENGKR